MTTNRDELLARIERDVLEAVTRGAVKGEMSETTLGSIRHTIREIFSSLPQRPEGAAVASRNLFAPGDIVRHRKGGEYMVLFRADYEPTMTDCYVYRGEDGHTWVRPALVMEDGRFTLVRRGQKSPPASAVAEHGEPMSDGQIAYERAFPDSTNRVPFKLLPDWMEHQWHRQAERDKTAQAATVSDPLPKLAQFIVALFNDCEFTEGLDDHADLKELAADLGIADEVIENRFVDDDEAPVAYRLAPWIRALASSPAAPATVIPESEKDHE